MAENVLFGKITSVDINPAGSVLSEGALSGETELAVSDVFDFTPDGGFVTINGEAYGYVSIDEGDEDGGTVTLGTPLLADVDVETPILVEPYAETKIAKVTLEDGGDWLDVVVPHALDALLEVGQRAEDNAETVVMEARGYQLLITDVVGLRAELNSDVTPPPTDGVPPETSPDPTAIGGIGAIFLRWTAIENADPVTYEVHMATFPDFTPDGTTLVTTTAASSVTLRALPDADPLAYDTVYYFKIVATDADGPAAPSAEATAQMMRVTGPDIAVDYVYAGNIIANQIIGGTINADLFMSGSIKTAEAGARVELGAFGFVVYDASGTPTTLLGSDGISTFKGQVLASTLSVTDGMSIRGTANELAQAGEFTLAAGVSASPNAPTVVTGYETMPTWKTSGGASWPAGYEYRCMQRIGTDWLVGMRQVSTDEFMARQFNDDGSFDSWYGTGWIGEQIQRCAYVNSGLPVYAFRQTDRRVIAATHSISGGAEVNSISWNFTSGQPAGTTEAGTVSYPSGRCRLSVPSTPSMAASLGSSTTMDMRGRRVTAQVFPIGSFSSVGQRIELRMRNANAGEYILARIEGDLDAGQIKLQTYNGTAGSTITAFGSFPSGYNWWRLSESNGAARLQVSTNGSSWSTVATIANHGLTDTDLASMTLSLIVDDEDDGSATTGEFDNVTVGAGFVDFGDVPAWTDVSHPPALGSDGTYILAAEINGTGQMKIYELDPRSPGRVVAQYTSATHVDFTDAEPLITVIKGSFDFGGTRFIVTEGSSGNQASFVFTVSGSTLTYQRNESFYVPGQAGMGWDGTVFQTLATDGVRRKHTSILWASTADWERTFYAATTWYDGDATGGTHETTPSPRAAFSLRKRARYTVTSATIPDLGGTNDPDRIRIYLSDSAVATLWRQTTTAAGVNSAVLTATTLSGTAAPISNDFPGAIAARIVNEAGTLDIAGDGTIEGTTIAASTAMTAPLATFDQLIVTDRTLARVAFSGASVTLTTTPQDLTGLTYTVPVAGTSDAFTVTMVFDFGANTGGDRTAVGELVVNGVTQVGQALVSLPTTGLRLSCSQSYLITGLAAGSRIFKGQVFITGGSSGTLLVRSIHTTMTIVQIA